MFDNSQENTFKQPQFMQQGLMNSSKPIKKETPFVVIDQSGRILGNFVSHLDATEFVKQYLSKQIGIAYILEIQNTYESTYQVEVK